MPTTFAWAMTEEHRLARYRGPFDAAVSADPIAALRSHLAQQRAYGNDRFQQAIERQLGRVACVRRPRRPAASGHDSDRYRLRLPFGN